MFSLVMQFEGMGQEQYEAVMKELHLKVGGNGGWPDGIVSHTAGKTANGWCVIDVWESEAAWNAFFQHQLQPAFEKVGGLANPHVTILQVYNRFPR
jgi:hypothetical protein